MQPRVALSRYRASMAVGACLALPEGFTGQVLCRQQPEPPSDETSVSWQATQCFSALHYWNHDAHPAAMDGVPRVLEWLAAAKAVRSSVRHSSFQHVYAALVCRAAHGLGVVCTCLHQATRHSWDCCLQMAEPVSSEALAKEMQAVASSA